MMEASLPVVCILGPTASGKTDLAIELRQLLGFDVISVDSALVYKRMDIGTAKPDNSILNHTPHALINLIEPWQSYSVSKFVSDAQREIDQCHASGNVPLLVGGTMLYFHALWHGLSSLPPADAAIRTELQQQLKNRGAHYMHTRLMFVDPEAAARIDPHDPQRLLRALEVFEITGTPLSKLQQHRTVVRSYDFYSIGFFPTDRTVLHSNIALRFDLMLHNGLVDEVATLLKDPRIHSELSSMRCVGYRQVCAFLKDLYSYREMSEKAVVATRQLAKRQLTWMRKMEQVKKVDLRYSARQLTADNIFLRWCNRHQIRSV